VLSWSGGKDSAFALHALATDPAVDVRGLLTTVTDGYDRVSMHGVRVELVAEQAAALGLPLSIVRIPPQCSNARYEEATGRALDQLRATGVAAIAFGDLYLADVRAYRERLVETAGLRAIFPLWGRPTAAVAAGLVRSGFRAILSCVDPTRMDVSHCGKEFDETLLGLLPASADPCGENGEFHTFVTDGPMFGWPIDPRRGIIVERDGFVFCDLLPRDGARATSGDASRGGMARA
jgi:uncharacterized protein (TIGR00290 family)